MLAHRCSRFLTLLEPSIFPDLSMPLHQGQGEGMGPQREEGGDLRTEQRVKAGEEGRREGRREGYRGKQGRVKEAPKSQVTPEDAG